MVITKKNANLPCWLQKLSSVKSGFFHLSACVCLFVHVCLCICVYQGDSTVYVCSSEPIFNGFSPRSAPSLCYARNEQGPSLTAPSADSRESRSLCGCWGEQKTFPPEELWVPVDKEAKRRGAWGRVYMLVYCGDVSVRWSLALFQTTSGCCINSHAWKHQSVGWVRRGGKFLPSDQDCQLEQRTWLLRITAKMEEYFQQILNSKSSTTGNQAAVNVGSVWLS